MTDFGTNKKPFTIKEISVHKDLIELPHINEWEPDFCILVFVAVKGCRIIMLGIEKLIRSTKKFFLIPL